MSKLTSAAYILHRYPSDERQVCLDLFTYTRGRITVWYALSAHFRKNQMGILQAFVPIWVEFQKKRPSNLAWIEAMQFRFLKGKSLLCALYVNELLIQVLKKDMPHEALFLKYDQTIGLLSEGRLLAQPLRIFEKHLLADLGYGLNLECDRMGDRIQPEARYDFEPDTGFNLNLSGGLSGQTLRDLREERFCSEKTLKEAKLILQSAIRFHFPMRRLGVTS